MGCRLSGLWLDDSNGIKGRDLSQISQRDAIQFLGSYEQPITLQIKGQKGRCHHHHSNHQSPQNLDCSTQTERTWDALRCLGIPVGSVPQVNIHTDRWYCGHVTQPLDHHSTSHYLPSIPFDMETTDRLQDSDPELSSCVSKRQSCLIGCCDANTEEPSSFLNQTEDEDPVQEKPLGYLPLLHELDSGLGCTDGSFHQGELSAADTEEGLEEPVSSPPGRTSRGSSPSSESLISSELSDSGFYSVSTGEFRRFQRLLEKRIRLYRARMASRDQREGHKACWDLESIPETLTCQPQNNWIPDTSPTCTTHQCTMGSSSVQFRKASNAHLSRYCSSTGSVFPAETGTSHCSTPSCQRRISVPLQNLSAEYMCRSHTLHRPSPPAMERRRASHPASPNYHEAIMPCCREFSAGFQGRADLAPVAGYCGGSPWQQEPMADYQGISPREHYINGDYNLRGGMVQDDLVHMGHQMQESESERPQHHFHTLDRPQDVHETWPKSANRCGSKNPYGTVGGHSPNTRRALAGNPRALRNQLLKARASQLADERSEVTTDEEAHGEVRTGRYWNKTERRRHLLLAREHRQQRMARPEPHYIGDVGGCSAVLELSHRKLSRLRNRNLLDDWTTVEELLTHGNRVSSSEAIPCPSPLLSVTTV